MQLLLPLLAFLKDTQLYAICFARTFAQQRAHDGIPMDSIKRILICFDSPLGGVQLRPIDLENICQHAISRFSS